MERVRSGTSKDSVFTLNKLAYTVRDTPANSIINIKHSFRITYDIYTPKHTFFITIL